MTLPRPIRSFSPIRFLPIGLLLGFGLLACTSVNHMIYDESRQTYVQQEGLTGTDSVHVVEQRVYRGMAIEHALVALGEPNQSDTTVTDDGTQIRYVYVSGANAFDPGSKPRGYLYAVDGTVTDWKGLDQIPRLDAYYEGGM